MVRGRQPSTAMAERGEQALNSYKACLKCTTLPDSKKGEVEIQLSHAKNTMMEMTQVCNQS